MLTRPPLKFRYDPVLALRAAARVMLGEPMPTPQQVSETDLAWESDVAKAVSLIKFHEDFAKRPAHMQ